MGPHVAILIAWGTAAAGCLARLLTASGGARSEVVAEIREVQGGGTPWRWFQGPPKALGRVWGGAPEQQPHAVHTKNRVQAECLQNGFQIKI